MALSFATIRFFAVIRHTVKVPLLWRSTQQRRKRLPTSIPAQRSLILLIGLLLAAEELTRER
jgi:hypothetical protein